MPQIYSAQTTKKKKRKLGKWKQNGWTEIEGVLLSFPHTYRQTNPNIRFLRQILLFIFYFFSVRFFHVAHICCTNFLIDCAYACGEPIVIGPWRVLPLLQNEFIGFSHIQYYHIIEQFGFLYDVHCTHHTAIYVCTILLMRFGFSLISSSSSTRPFPRFIALLLCLSIDSGIVKRLRLIVNDINVKLLIDLQFTFALANGE